MIFPEPSALHPFPLPEGNEKEWAAPSLFFLLLRREGGLPSLFSLEGKGVSLLSSSYKEGGVEREGMSFPPY